MTSALWPRSGDRQLNDSGRIMPLARLYFFDAGTTTPRTVYSNASRTAAHAHPVEADAYGKWPQVYIAPGSYRYRIHDGEGVAIDDFDGIIAPDDPTASEGAQLSISPFWLGMLDKVDAVSTLTALGFSTGFLPLIDDVDMTAVRTAIDAQRLGNTPIVADTVSRALVLTDVGKTLEMTNASACIYTIPLNATVAFPIGTWINIVRTGAGALNITAVSGVNFNGVPSLGAATCIISGQWQGASLRKTATDTWRILGSHSNVA